MRRVRPTLALSLALGLALGATIAARAATKPADMFSDADRNHDGQVTLAEMKATKAEGFKKLDVDRNGVLTIGDVSRWSMVMGRKGADQRWAQFKADFDANSDGQLTRVEFVNSVSPAFRIADRNGDGVVTAAERQTALAGR